MIARVILIVLLTGIIGKPAAAQETPINLVGRLRVEVAGVEVRRVNTAAWLPVRVESIIGAGDSIRTGEKGIAALNFFDGVMIVSIQPTSEIRLKSFTGAPDAFALEVQAVRGFSDYTTRRALNEKARFQVTLPTFRALIVTGELRTRVEADNRSAALNISRGQSFVLREDAAQIELIANAGVRLAIDQKTGEVVPATSFPTLDSALDGCPSATNVAGDVDINVRKSPSLEAERIGGIPGISTVQAIGATGDGWTRIVFKDGYGWINLSKLPLEKTCAGLRRYPDGYTEP